MENGEFLDVYPFGKVISFFSFVSIKSIYLRKIVLGRVIEYCGYATTNNERI